MMFFKPKTIRSRLNDVLYEAQKSHLEHETVAKHTMALAKMYAERVVWIKGQIEALDVPATTTLPVDPGIEVATTPRRLRRAS